MAISRGTVMEVPTRPVDRGWSRRWGIVLVVGLLAILAVGAGAAAGQLLGSGTVTAQNTVAVAQSLSVAKPVPHNFPPGRRFFSSVSDDGTRFSIALELFRGESVSVLVPLVNRSSEDTVARFSVVLPNVPSLIDGNPGLSLDATGSGLIDDVAKDNGTSWSFTLDGGAAGANHSPTDGLILAFSVAPTSMSGYFEVTGRIRMLEV